MEPFNNLKSNKPRKTDSSLGLNGIHHDLSFNAEKNSFEFDITSDDADYDHPLPYDTTAANGGDENSDYDESNPYIGDEYNRKQQLENEFENLAMHLDYGESVILSPEDQYLARTSEDERPDLDEEGYPINDLPRR